jgi:hypothetical protein
MEFKDITEKHQLIFSKEVNYDTRKTNNRSLAVIPQSIIKEIEEQGVTIERIDALDIPVFKYKTQITLHGVFDEKMSNYAGFGGYKNLIVNQNKSLGVRYNGVDGKKKSLIAEALSFYNKNDADFKFRVQADSRGFAILKSAEVSTKEQYLLKRADFERELNSIPDIFIGGKYINAFSYMGIIFLRLEINLNAIKQKNLFKFISHVTGGTINSEEDINLLKSNTKKEKEQHFAKLQAERDERYAKKLKLQAEYKANNPIPYPTLTKVPEWKKGEYFVYGLVAEKNDGSFAFLARHVSFRPFGKMKKYSNWHEKPNPELIKTDFDKDKDLSPISVADIKGNIEKGNAYLIYDSSQKSKPLSTPKQVALKNEVASTPVNVQGVQIARNLAKNGIEIKFPSKPEETILDWIKSKSFRWGKYNSVWYTTYSEALWNEVNAKFSGTSVVKNQFAVLFETHSPTLNRVFSEFTQEQAQIWEDWRIANLKVGTNLYYAKFDEVGNKMLLPCSVESLLVDEISKADHVSVWLPNDEGRKQTVLLSANELYYRNNEVMPLPISLEFSHNPKEFDVRNQFLKLYSEFNSQLKSILS